MRTGTLLFFISVVLVLGQVVAKQQDLRRIAEGYKERSLCFIGRLDAYTDFRGVVVSTNEIARGMHIGMQFAVLWNPNGMTNATHWMHICNLPIGIVPITPFLGATGQVFALTLEGPAHSTAASVTNWPNCSDFYKFTAIRIEPDGSANGSQPIRSGTNTASSAAGSRR